MKFARHEVLAPGIEIYQGDCRDIVPSLSIVDACVSDPPYGMQFRSNHRAEKHDAITFDNEAWPLEFACAFPVRHSRYVFARWDDLPRVPKPRSLVTWVKNNWSMGDLDHEHARQTEVAFFYAGPDHFFPTGRPSDVIVAPRTGNNFHPTEKPVHLMAAIIRWTDGVVIDPFMGSGTTGVACVQLGRKFIGIELEPRYFDIAVKRISDELKRPRLDLGEPVAKPVQEVML